MSVKIKVAPGRELLRAFETVPDLYLILSPDLLILTASDAYLAATFTIRKQMTGRHVFDVFPDNPAAREAKAVANLRASLQTVLETKKPHRMARQHYDEPDGSGGFVEKYWLPVNTPVLDEQGDVWYIIHKVEDITDLVRQERKSEWLSRDVVTLQEAGQKLKVSNDLLQSVFDASPNSIAVFTILYDQQGEAADFEIVRYNAFTLKTTGLTHDEVVGRRYSEVFPNSVETGILDRFKNVARTGEMTDFDQWYVGEGMQHWFRFRAVKTGNLLVVTTDDITAQKKAEQELVQVKEELARRATDKYLALFNSMDEGFCILQLIFDEAQKPLDYRYLEINPAFEQHTGFRNAVGKTIRELVPDMEPFWFEIYGKVALTGEPIRFDDYAEAMSRWFEVYAYRIGQPHERQVAVFFKDITGRKRMEEARRLAEEKYRNLFYSIDQGYAIAEIIVNEQGQSVDYRMLEVNPQFEKLTGIPTGIALSGKTIREIAPELEEKWYQIYGKVALTGEPARFEEYAQDWHRWYDVYAFRMREPEKRQIAILFSEVTERKRNEEALRQSAARQAFLLKLSDRLRPLGDATEIQYQAACALGEYLGASRVGYAEDQGDGETVVVTRNYTNGIQGVEGCYHYNDYGTALLTELRAGRTVVHNDIAHDPALTDAEKAAHQALQLGAAVNMPLLKNGQLAAIIFMHYKEAHAWSADELALLEETAERTWAAVLRARAEEALRESEARFRLMVDAVPESIWITDASGNVEFLNQQWFDYCGSSFEFATAAEVASNYLHPNDAPKVMAVFGEAIRTGSPFEVEQRNRSATGEYRWFLNRATPYHDPKTGRIIKWIGISVDIHDRKLAEEALRLSEERFRALVTQAAVGITETVDGRFTYVNDRYCEITGYSRADLIGRSVADITHPDEVADNMELLNRMYETGEPFVFDKRYLRSDGSIVWVHNSVTPTLDPQGRILGGLAASIDITDRKRAEEALLEADRHKNEFLALLAHELRNPLSTLNNTLLILQMTGGTDESLPLESAIGMMNREVRQLVRLVDDLLDVSRISQGKTQLRRQRIDLTELVRLATQAARLLVERGHRQLSLTLPAEPIYLNGDATRLTQVVRNLLGNAAKFTREGGHIDLSLARADQQAILRVVDDGIGIPPDELDRIFEMFAQVNASLARTQEGLGLGLTLVKELVELHGGRVEAHSEGADRGSTFTIYLPLEPE